MSDEQVEHPAAQVAAGDRVLGSTLTKVIAEGGGVRVFKGRAADNSATVVYVLLIDDAEVRKRFVAAAREMAERRGQIEGLAEVTRVDDALGAYEVRFDVLRPMSDAAILDYNEQGATEAFVKLCRVIHELHEAGIIHGCLRPEDVLVNAAGDLVVAGAKAFDVGEMCRSDPAAVALYRVYAPQEQRFGRAAGPQTDIFSLGRIYHLLLMAQEPDEKDETLPSLEVLGRFPNGLRRIVRACVTGDLEHRYDRVDEILDDLVRFKRHEPVGLPHPDHDQVAAVARAKVAREEAIREGRVHRTSAPVEIMRGTGGSDSLSLGKRIGLLLLGLVILVGPIAIAYVASAPSMTLSIITFFCAVPWGLAAPGFGRPPILGRALIATAILGVLVFLDPARLAGEADAAHSGLKSPDLAMRIATVKELRAAGETDLREADLTGASLVGEDMAGVTLDGGSLKGCQCAGVNFAKASFWNVDVEGADFSAANLAGVMPAVAKNWQLARCDDRTTMPAGWACQDGHPAQSTRGK
ncbi:MAG: pentapeptide repeat-containing protein [Myxococcales bacterium]|nr:pentapeptide repeat-containing protein [Myxococcales bacterium]